MRRPRYAARYASAWAERAYGQRLAAGQEWQRGLRDLIVKTRPDLATLAMEQQLALLDRRQAQFQYLLRTDVRRIHTREGLSSLLNFDWTDADAQQGHRDWPVLRDHVRTVSSTTPDFQALLKRLQERELEIEGRLKECPRP